MITLADRAGLDSIDRRARCADLVAQVESLGLKSVRLAFADLHGLLRGKALRADLLADALQNGLGITSALLLKDTGQNNVFPVWADGAGLGESWLTGAGDVMMLPDPSTFRVLPWADSTGWVLCDIVSPDGSPVPYSTRRVGQEAVRALDAEGLVFRAGLEVEFHLYRRPDHAGDVVDTHPGRVYLGEQRYDLIEPALEVFRDDLTAMGLPPRSMEIELGPSQAEITFDASDGLETADTAVLLRSAVKQIAVRHGLHATFMAAPHRPGSFPSGWHLHQSLVDGNGRNAFTTDTGGLLSELGSHYLAGLLAHAAESCLLTTPTVTGYKRYRPSSLAPHRVAWGTQHRGAMLRLVGGGDQPGTRIENRLGDPASNPYLYLASQMISGQAGMDAAVDPPPPVTDPYADGAGPVLPSTLGDAIERFDGSALYRKAMGDDFVDYLVAVKRAEWSRFLATVTDWEQTEYFDLF